MSMLEFVRSQLFSIGGPILVALLLSSIVGLSTFIVKAVQFARLGVGRHRPAREAMAAWRNGDAGTALALVQRDSAALSQVTAAGLRQMSSPGGLISLATTLLAEMSRHLRIIEAVVQAAPMLGLLGTVLGMMEAFNRLSQSGGAADPAVLASGIWTALSTTALGLSVAIPFYFLSTWLESRVENERMAMEAVLASFSDER
ncbi:biopolymer transport protein ExbB [Devosia sp. UYZn731]|uniref:MotA/TolQ/ExbB proton channel family protein n=1 Tax=Devosia sp. UYZn731 TaxID=3156345 RepID=UPI00339AE066